MSFPQGPGNGNNPNPNNNRNNGNPFTNPFNRGNNGNNGKGNKENRPIWQSPWLWGAVLVVMVVLMFQMFAGGGTKTIDTKDGFALINQGKATYAEITDNKQVVRLELKNDYTKKNADTGKVTNYGKNVQFYYTFAQGAQVAKAVENGDLEKGWTSNIEQTSVMSYLITSILPFVIILALFWWLMSRMGGAGGMLGMGGGHDEREQTLNQLLVEMDGFDNDTNLIIIAATNRPDVLDPALLRPGRFDRQVGVAAPDLEGREAILRVHAKGKPFVPDVDLHMVAVRTPGFTGADLANVLNEAALLCARAGAQLIDNRAIDEAIDRVQAGPKRKSKGMALEELRNTAYHEGGHALVAAALNNTDPVTKVTILPRGRALGYTAVMPTSDRYSQSRNQLLDQMAYAMGGRTAEEIVFHDPTTGASNDIEKATNIARTMVIEYGFSDKLGAIKWGSDDDQTTVMDGLQPRKYSDRTAEVIDDEVLKLVETAHTEAWTIINDNREILDELVRQLLVKETLNEKELAAIFAPIKKAPVRPVWLSNDRRPDSDKPPVEIPESLKRSVGMKPEE